MVTLCVIPMSHLSVKTSLPRSSGHLFYFMKKMNYSPGSKMLERVHTMQKDHSSETSIVSCITNGKNKTKIENKEI
jgi:hypothetical protein